MAINYLFCDSSPINKRVSKYTFHTCHKKTSKMSIHIKGEIATTMDLMTHFFTIFQMYDLSVAKFSL